jgi:hypothetical protein
MQVDPPLCSNQARQYYHYFQSLLAVHHDQNGLADLINPLWVVHSTESRTTREPEEARTGLSHDSPRGIKVSLWYCNPNVVASETWRSAAATGFFTAFGTRKIQGDESSRTNILYRLRD